MEKNTYSFQICIYSLVLSLYGRMGRQNCTGLRKHPFCSSITYQAPRAGSLHPATSTYYMLHKVSCISVLARVPPVHVLGLQHTMEQERQAVDQTKHFCFTHLAAGTSSPCPTGELRAGWMSYTTGSAGNATKKKKPKCPLAASRVNQSPGTREEGRLHQVPVQHLT